MSIFSNVGEKIKEHPYIAATAVFAVGAIVIYSYVGSSSSTAAAVTPGTSTATTATNDAAAIAAASQLQLGQLAAQVSVANSGNSLAAVQANDTAQVSIAQLALQASTGNNSTAVQLAQVGAGVTEQQISAASGVSLASIAAASHQNDNATSLAELNTTDASLANLGQQQSNERIVGTTENAIWQLSASGAGNTVSGQQGIAALTALGIHDATPATDEFGHPA